VSNISTNSNTTTPTATKSPGLSQGAKVGIGVGVALGVVALASLLAGVLLFRRKRQRYTAATQTAQYSKPELDSISKNVPVYELTSEISSHEMGPSMYDRPLAMEMSDGVSHAPPGRM
jgi:hypothetical protein